MATFQSLSTSDFQPLTKEFLLGQSLSTSALVANGFGGSLGPTQLPPMTTTGKNDHDYAFMSAMGSDGMPVGSSTSGHHQLLQQNMGMDNTSLFSHSPFNDGNGSYSGGSNTGSVAGSSGFGGSDSGVNGDSASSSSTDKARKKKGRKSSGSSGTSATAAAASQKAAKKAGKSSASSASYAGGGLASALALAQGLRGAMDMKERLHRKRKRPTSKREPLPDEYGDEGEYNVAWAKWREDRDHNNRSVKRSRQRAKLKKAEAIKATTTSGSGPSKKPRVAESPEEQLEASREDLGLLVRALKKDLLSEHQQERIKELMDLYDDSDGDDSGAGSSRSDQHQHQHRTSSSKPKSRSRGQR